MAFVADFYGRSHSSDRFMADGGGFSVFGIIADLIGGSHKPGRKKNSHKVVCSEGCRIRQYGQSSEEKDRFYGKICLPGNMVRFHSRFLWVVKKHGP